MWCIQTDRLGSERSSLECEAHPSNVSFYGKLLKTHFIPVSPHWHGCSNPWDLWCSCPHPLHPLLQWQVGSGEEEKWGTANWEATRCSSFHRHESEPRPVQTLLSTLSSALSHLSCQCVGDTVRIMASDQGMQIMTIFSRLGKNWSLVRCSKRNSYQCPSFGAPPYQATEVYLSLSWYVTKQCVSVHPNSGYKIGTDFCPLDKCSLSNQNTHHGPHTAFPAVKLALVVLAWKKWPGKSLGDLEPATPLKDLKLLLAGDLWPKWPFGSLPLPSRSAQKGPDISLSLPSAQLSVMSDKLKKRGKKIKQKFLRLCWKILLHLHIISQNPDA